MPNPIDRTAVAVVNVNERLFTASRQYRTNKERTVAVKRGSESDPVLECQVRKRFLCAVGRE